MIDRMLGLALIVGSIICFVVASMPIVQTLLGGPIYDNMQWMKSNLFWLLPVGFVLYLRLWAAPAPPVLIGIAVSIGLLYYLTVMI
jgi:hypothetical protein